MTAEFPLERLEVEVSFDNRGWHPATYVHGEFVDIFGLPIQRERILSWRPADAAAPAPENRS